MSLLLLVLHRAAHTHTHTHTANTLRRLTTLRGRTDGREGSRASSHPSTSPPPSTHPSKKANERQTRVIMRHEPYPPSEQGILMGDSSLSIRCKPPYSLQHRACPPRSALIHIFFHWRLTKKKKKEKRKKKERKKERKQGDKRPTETDERRGND